MQKADFTQDKTIQRPVAYAFIYVNSPATKEQYPKRLKTFFDFIGLQSSSPSTIKSSIPIKKNTKTTKEESAKRKAKFMEGLELQAQAFLERARQDDTWISEQLMFYLDHHKERVLNRNHKEGHISAGTLHNLLKPIRLFLEAYPDIDRTINWKRIKKALPRAKLYANDRSPSIEEIRKLVQYHDRRIKPIVYTMCSSGIRVGAWVGMQWKQITPIKDPKTHEIIAARLLVYPGTGEEYITFMTAEAYKAISEWMDFRASYGEQINGDSYVMRSLWRTVDIKRKHAGNFSRINEPEQLSEKAICRMLIRALDQQGIRPELAEDVKRHPFQGAHGMRKFFKTRAEQAMLRTNVEYIIGHSLGLSQSYYRPTEHELLTDYLKAIPYLSINDENAIDIKSLREEQQILVKKTEVKDRELEEMKDKMKLLEENLKQNSSVLLELMAKIPNTLMKVEKAKPGDSTVEAEIRVYKDKKVYSKAVKEIKQEQQREQQQ